MRQERVASVILRFLAHAVTPHDTDARPIDPRDDPTNIRVGETNHDQDSGSSICHSFAIVPADRCVRGARGGAAVPASRPLRLRRQVSARSVGSRALARVHDGRIAWHPLAACVPR